MYDVVFRNVRILDGTGAPWFRGNVAVKDGRIARVGAVEGKGLEDVDCEDNYICPGFIDIHSHSDQALVTTPTADSKVMQGITLEVVGQCGASAAPRGLNPDADEETEENIRPSWTDMGSYLDVLERNGISVNVIALVGHGSIRRQVMGSLMRPPTPEELSRMKELVASSLDQGAWGMSTGLIYVPGVYARTEEIVELTKVVASRRGVYFTHLRNEGANLLEAIEEALRIGNEAGVPVQISHFKAAGKANWGKVVLAIEKIEQARCRGIDVTADQYPYVASSTSLAAFVPPWVWEGGREAGLARLEDPAERRRIIAEAASGREIWSNLVVAGVSSVPDSQFIGKNIEEVAGMTGTSPEEACLGLLVRNHGIVQIVNFCMNEDDVKTVMKQPWVMVGTDARVLKRETAKGQPHPRAYGTFPRVLARYVRESQTLRLEEAVRKMTSLPATRLGLQDRGVLREGMWADLVLFDASRIADTATYTDPHHYASGILRVLVNGVHVVSEGKHTGRRPGRVLRH